MTEAALSKLGLGCSRVGSFNNPQPLRESISLIQAALDLGITTIDTANIYGQGDSERAIGRAVHGRRDHAFIVTKTGKGFSQKMRMLRWLKPMLRPVLARRNAGASAVTTRREAAMREIWRPEAFAASLDGSLRRLDTSYVDGLLLHSPPADIIRQPAVAAALLALKQAGKARHVGISCDDLESLEAALEIPGLTLLQLPIDVIQATNPLATRIRAQGILVLAREVITLQPSLSPIGAVQASVRSPVVTSTLVGTTKLNHLRALAAAV